MEPEPEPEPEVVPILRTTAGGPAAPTTATGGEGQRVVWDEENLLQNEAERPEGGYMKIDEPDTPFEYTVRLACLPAPRAQNARLRGRQGVPTVCCRLSYLIEGDCLVFP
jgi:hypothetical protein